MTANEDQIHYWNEVAGAKWVQNQDLLDRLMAPLTEALIAAAAPRTDELVLDVGCGCGDLSLRLARLVGEGGYIRAIDVSRPMLIHAEERRRVLPSDGLATIQWIAADASRHRFPPVNDLLVSRFGVMFFDDPPRAFANLRAAMGPDARFAVLTWRRRSEVEWMQQPLEWIASLVPTPDEVPGEIGPFALADAPATCAMLTAAGFRDVVAEPLDRPLVMGIAAPGADDPDAAAVADAATLLGGTGPVARLLGDEPPEVRDQALGLLRDGLRGRAKDGRVMLNGACWIYRGVA